MLHTLHDAWPDLVGDSDEALDAQDAVTTGGEQDIDRFTEAVDVLLATCGDRILRVKGLVAVADEVGPRVVQCVQHMRYPARSLPEWPDDDRQSRLVFIVRALERQIVDQAFIMFCGTAASGEG